jgi:hypothetical protein
MEFEIIYGGSGKWIAKEIDQKYSFGRCTYTGKVFNGHAPINKVSRSEFKEIIKRQLKRKLQENPEGDDYECVGGGSCYIEEIN